MMKIKTIINIIKKDGIKMADKKIVCKDCFREFTFTEGEQEYYKEKGFENPKRCPSCRTERKKRYNK